MRIIAALIVTLLATAQFAVARSCFGCPKIIDVAEQNVQKAVHFAVGELSKSTVDQVRVLNAAVQVVSGLNYHLTFEMQQGNSLDIFQAVVYKNASATNAEYEHTLLSFDALLSRKVQGAHCAGCVTDANIADEDVLAASKFAWAEVEKLDRDVDLTFGLNYVVVAAGRQVVNGINYQLLLTAEFDNIRVQSTVNVYRSAVGELNLIRSTLHKAIIPVVAPPAPVRTCRGCAKAIDIGAQEVASAVTFAVSQISSVDPASSTVKIIAAAVQVVKGLNYHVTFEVQSGQSLDIFKAVVYKDVTGADATLLSLDALISRKTVACLGCVQDVSVDDVLVRDVSSYAWSEAEKIDDDVVMTMGKNMQVVAAGYQVVNGINYYLLMSGEFDHIRVHYTATVYRSVAGGYTMIRSTFNKAVI